MGVAGGSNVGVAVAAGTAVGMRRVAVGVRVGVAVAVDVTVAVGVSVGVAVGVGVGVAVMSRKWTRTRPVTSATANHMSTSTYSRLRLLTDIDSPIVLGAPEPGAVSLMASSHPVRQCVGREHMPFRVFHLLRTVVPG